MRSVRTVGDVTSARMLAHKSDHKDPERFAPSSYSLTLVPTTHFQRNMSWVIGGTEPHMQVVAIEPTFSLSLQTFEINSLGIPHLDIRPCEGGESLST